ncbi:THAP domain-containing protein 11-like [Achroia grisella]|uniref:THAP domain-containing protein 11-like n=1 Tax=Achroia grisella TaxID=688607 RepID=UPI0027D26F10|nr:THAP domain-containing protein 11-like [Achroia grisella]
MASKNSVYYISGTLCSVDGCRSSKRRDKNLSFFHLPADKKRRDTWAKLIGRPDLSDPKKRFDSHSVCSLHFEPCMITYTPKLRRNTVPTRQLPHNSSNDEIIATNSRTRDMAIQTDDCNDTDDVKFPNIKYIYVKEDISVDVKEEPESD